VARAGNIEHAAAVAARLLSERPPVPEAHPYTLDQMLDKTIALYEAVVSPAYFRKADASRRN
jgi:hypothetical protein